jgi:hypothetical protein
MALRGRQGLLPFRMEAASRPMDMTSQAGLPLVAELLEALGRGGPQNSDSMLRWLPDSERKDGSHEEAAGLFRETEGQGSS